MVCLPKYPGMPLAAERLFVGCTMLSHAEDDSGEFEKLHTDAGCIFSADI
jgi:hypothetical protein